MTIRELSEFADPTAPMEARARLLVVDDDPSLRELLQIGLESEGFAVTTAEDGPTALAQFDELDPDLVVLDVLMPGMDGMELCRRIRQQSPVPIIMLTAKRNENDVVLGLESGADDYVTKPFSVRELAARVKSLRRRLDIDMRQTPRTNERFEFDDGRFVLDGAKQQVEVDGQPVGLSRTEFALLHVLVTNVGRVVSHNEIMERLWKATGPPEQSKLRTYMGLLRRKIGERGRSGRYLHSHHGSGYRFEPVADQSDE